MKIEFSDQAIEDIMCETLKEHMKYMKKNIKDLKKKKGSLEPYQAQDLGNDIKMLAAMEEVYSYFGGNIK